MKYCSKCGTSNGDSDSFCHKCGSELLVYDISGQSDNPTIVHIHQEPRRISKKMIAIAVVGILLVAGIGFYVSFRGTASFTVYVTSDHILNTVNVTLTFGETTISQFDLPALNQYVCTFTYSTYFVSGEISVLIKAVATGGGLGETIDFENVMFDKGESVTIYLTV